MRKLNYWRKTTYHFADSESCTILGLTTSVSSIGIFNIKPQGGAPQVQQSSSTYNVPLHPRKNFNCSNTIQPVLRRFRSVNQETLILKLNFGKFIFWATTIFTKSSKKSCFQCCFRKCFITKSPSCPSLVSAKMLQEKLVHKNSADRKSGLKCNEKVLFRMFRS